jgi:hypothetical protein
MPRVSAFYGIVITMYFDENLHPGRPHFHAEYAGVRSSFDIESLEPIVGRLPPRVNRLVRKWARQHQGELRQNWALVRSGQAPIRIAPLP